MTRRLRGVGPGPEHPRRGRHAMMLMAAVLLASGCGGLPARTAVEEGLNLEADSPLRYVVAAPQAGASRTDIVRGFLQAGQSLQDRNAAARAYLAGQAARDWDPTRQVVVHQSDDVKVNDVGANQVRIRAPLTATVDQAGRYTEAAAGESMEATLTLALVDGEWRITEVDSNVGLWLSQYRFDSRFRAYHVNYLSATASRLIHDTRWLPLTSGLPTRLAQVQLGPVPEYLQGAADSAWPSETRLAVDAVPVQRRAAIVDLTPPAATLPELGRRFAWAQLFATLTQAPSVSSVVVQVNGDRLETRAVTGEPRSLAELGVLSSVPDPLSKIVVRQKEKLSVLDVEQLGRTGRVSESVDAQTSSMPTVGAEWGELAVSKNLDQVAAVSADRTQLTRWRDGHQERFPTFGSDLTITFDNQDGLWVGGRNDDKLAALWYLDAKASATGVAPREITTQWLGGSIVQQIRVARDGQRAALLLKEDTDRVVLGVSGIRRRSTGAPYTLNRPLRLGGSLATVSGVTWVDEDRLEVLGRASQDGEVTPFSIGLNGRTSPITDVNGTPTAIFSRGVTGSTMVHQLDQALLLQTPGRGWRTVSPVVDAVVTPPQ